MTRYAALDIGTNSQLMLVAERSADGRFGDVLDRATVTRLGQGLDHSGMLRADAMQRNLEQLAKYKNILDEMGVERIAAAGTLCLRKAHNATEFLERVEREIGVRIEVVSGEEEARLTYLGVQSGLPVSCCEPLVFDLGGGSTEFIMGRRGQVARRISLEVGAVRMTERFLHSDPAKACEILALSDHLTKKALESLHALSGFDALIGVGGTVTTLGAMHLKLDQYKNERIHGLQLTGSIVAALTRKLGKLDLASLKKLAGVDPKRADVILAGALIVRQVMSLVGAKILTVSDRGLRHGLLHERFGKPAD